MIDKACRVAPPQNLVLSQDFRRDFLFTNKLTSRHTGETETRSYTQYTFYNGFGRITIVILVSAIGGLFRTASSKKSENTQNTREA